MRFCSELDHYGAEAYGTPIDPYREWPEAMVAWDRDVVTPLQDQCLQHKLVCVLIRPSQKSSFSLFVVLRGVLRRQGQSGYHFGRYHAGRERWYTTLTHEADLLRSGVDEPLPIAPEVLRDTATSP